MIAFKPRPMLSLSRLRAASASILGLMFSLSVTAGTTAGSTRNGDSLPDVERAIQEGNRAYVAALERADARSFANLFAEDAISMPAHSPAIHGRAAIESSIATVFAEMTFSGGSVRTLETHLDGAVAYEIGTYDLDVVLGQSRQRLRGRYVSVWRKIDGTWKIAIDASQSDATLP